MENINEDGDEDDDFIQGKVDLECKVLVNFRCGDRLAHQARAHPWYYQVCGLYVSEDWMV